jgi:hypothetical protein
MGGNPASIFKRLGQTFDAFPTYGNLIMIKPITQILFSIRASRLARAGRLAALF